MLLTWGCVTPHVDDLTTVDCLAAAECGDGLACVSGACVACGPELCDGFDNDCDGATDEDFDVATSGEHCGACGQPCTGVCQGGVCLTDDGGGCVPTAEACDGADNDCDGQTDEGVLNACGACGSVPEEACDGADNDCDGQTDEGVANACGGCGPTPAEICDEADNDCDGQTDEGTLNACGECGGVPAERCDGADNDCDGQTDEAFPALGQACEAGVGACAAGGVVACTPDGDAACDAAPLAARDAELCGDGIDNDCDGAADEGLAVGQACEVGVGACARPGQTACDPDNPSALLCEGAPGDPSPEQCDDIDNDCDGVIDNGFDLQSDAQNCGACGVTCAFANGEGVCDDGLCALAACTPPFEDLDGDAANGCECDPGAIDAPDPSFADFNCDGVDGDAATSVFVAPLTGRVGGAGTLDDPVNSLTEALALVTPERQTVLLAEGPYLLLAPLALEGAVRLHGGYLHDPAAAPPAPRWARRAADDEQATRIVASPAIGPAILIQPGASVRLDNLRVEVSDGGPGDHAIALATQGCSELILSDVVVEVGAGGRGIDGVPGLPGDDTAGPGSPAQEGPQGAAGGLNPGCPAGTQGGVGGEGAAEGGVAAAGQPGGDAAPGGVAATADADAQPGEDGGAGAAAEAPGVVGAGGRVDPNALQWVALPAPLGGPGQPGGGGGGGGGGLSVGDLPGSGGGGGGAGACGGQAAQPGTQGNLSVGLFIAGDCRVRMVRSTVRTGGGGIGGAGALGGPSAAPGAPGPGLVGDLGRRGGAPGGSGGPGGCGAPAHGGHGGHSFGVLLAGGAPPEVDAQSVLEPGPAGMPGPGVEARDGCEAALPGELGTQRAVGCCYEVEACGDFSCPRPPE